MSTKQRYDRRKNRVSYSILNRKDKTRMRLSVFRSANHIYAQLVDDTKSHTVASASSQDKDLSLKNGRGTEAATKVGQLIGERALKLGIKQIVFCRGGRVYHGRIKSLADGAREAGLNF